MRPTDLLLDPLARDVSAFTAILLYVGLCCLLFRHEGRRRRSRDALTPVSADAPRWLVAYASQTGTSAQLAERAAQRLSRAGIAVRLLELNRLSRQILEQSDYALFVVSTYGEGDAPDNGALFADAMSTQAPHLTHLRYAVLALGDASYARYCGFGRALDAWLGACQATPMQARIEVNCGDASALAAWDDLLAEHAGDDDLPVDRPAFAPWRLIRRRHLNPGSQGTALFEIELLPNSGELPLWESGDLVQLLLHDGQARPREYSIASLPEEGALILLVRLHRDANGKTGLMSGWLSEAPLGSLLQLRIRPHPTFRLGTNKMRPLILIGNGSGLAGLRGHLKARAIAGTHKNWLIYGERNAAADSIWGAELEQWRASGVLQYLDRVYSRDGQALRYVQDALQEATDRLHEWVAADAAIYVCGSLEGMAEGVEKTLSTVLGATRMIELKQSGRYRRDVY